MWYLYVGSEEWDVNYLWGTYDNEEAILKWADKHTAKGRFVRVIDPQGGESFLLP